MNSKYPSDLGRIPGKIYSGEALWDHLSVVDRKILTHYIRICSILVSRIVETAFMNEAHQRLVEVIKLIENYYGLDMIMPNLHLSLHLCECAHDFSPLYAFWCFSFERINGMLGSFSNSHRKIEPEIMWRLMNDNQIANLISSRIETKGLDLLDNTTVVGSLSETDEFSLDEMRRYLLYSQDIQQSQITGQEPFPGEMLRPSTENILFREGPEGSIVINVKMNKFGRCRIGSEIFSSSMSSRYVNSSFILAKFVTSDGEVDCYPGQIQYFFKHTINLQNQSAEHFLAYVWWYQHVASSDVRYYFSSDDKTCTVELWRSEFYHESCDCIILVHHILGQFIPVKYKISDRQNAVEYLAINPINRKYHIK
ncbi:unnamed protein product [Rhizophagus irregularis]|nr:unnamed protein product [Rhizophagus irregularis]